MNHLLNLTALLLTFSGLAQQMPYNPDANGDDFVGVDDVLGVLGVYDTALMQPDLQCDYEGTDLEQLFGGLIAGNLVLDSVYVEYLLVDSVTTYLPECPDPVVIETVLERSFMYGPSSIYDYTYQVNPFLQCYENFLGYIRNLTLTFMPSNGTFRLSFADDEVYALTSFGNTTYWNSMPNSCCQADVNLPFPENWILNADGIEVDWSLAGWVHNCQNFRLIPFWHEAE